MRLAMAVLLLFTFASAARASDNQSRDAAKHFQRGVDLYNDGDFRGALVEFKKAYETWPRANVLYDIGQTQYQLLDYAGALATMNRYLAETGATAAHRQEVESTVEILRGRVGRLALMTDVAGCDVSVDDQPSGTTPLPQSLLVSVGPRRVTVACSGRPSLTRQVEIVAGERQELEVRIPAPPVARVAAPPPLVDRRPSRAGTVVGWTATGLLLGATIAVGTSTLVESSRLGSLKQSYPVDRGALDRKGSLVNGLSIASDVLGACALVAAGVSTWLTVKYRRETSRPRGAPGSRSAAVSWNGAGVAF